jgi:hypothetical protein
MPFAPLTWSQMQVNAPNINSQMLTMSNRIDVIESHLGFVLGVPPASATVGGVTVAAAAPSSCQAHHDAGDTSEGVKNICPVIGTCFDVYCRNKNGKAWTLVMTRGNTLHIHTSNTLSTGSPLVPMAGNGVALDAAQIAALKSVSSTFAFEVDATGCNANANGAADGHDNWGVGVLSALESGNTCENIGDDLTKCNLVHTEGSGCTFTGGDYNSIFGQQRRCNYFRNDAGPTAIWSTGAACASGGMYAEKADLYFGSHSAVAPHQTCQDWYDAGDTADGVKSICPVLMSCFDAHCRFKDGKAWTLVMTRADGKPVVSSAALTPMSGDGTAISSANWVALRSATTSFAFEIDEASCGAGHDNWGEGYLSTLESGNTCENIGDDLTKCNLVHNEVSGCTFTGSDYNSIFGVAKTNGANYNTDRCNYFSNDAGPTAIWSTGGTCSTSGWYATKSDLYVN